MPRHSSALLVPPGLLAFGAALAMSLLAIWYGGVRLGADSSRYVVAAQQILEGQWPTPPKSAAHLGFVALTAAVLRVTGSIDTLVVINALALGLCASAVVVLASRIFGANGAVLAAVGTPALAELAIWSAYVLTDVIYTSALTGVTILIALGGDTPRTRPLAALLCACTALLRPEGWLLLPIALILWFGRGSHRRWLGTAAAVIAAVLITAISVPAFRSGVQAEMPEQWLTRGTVIWGSDAWSLQMPATLTPPRSWVEGLAYGAAHPLAAGRLALTRVAVELAHVRPYYSRAHNAAVVLLHGPLYALAALGAWQARRDVTMRLLLTVVAAHLTIVALTFADYDGRFVLHVLPLVVVCGAGGASTLRSRLSAARQEYGAAERV